MGHVIYSSNPCSGFSRHLTRSADSFTLQNTVVHLLITASLILPCDAAQQHHHHLVPILHHSTITTPPCYNCWSHNSKDRTISILSSICVSRWLSGVVPHLKNWQNTNLISIRLKPTWPKTARLVEIPPRIPLQAFNPTSIIRMIAKSAPSTLAKAS